MTRVMTVLMALVVAVSLVGAATAADHHRAQVRTPYQSKNLLTILVIGSDLSYPMRPGNPRRGRADAIHLIAVDTKRKRATIVDFPRDSLIGGTKVNAHLSYGGPQGLANQVAAYSGIKIDYWALTSFNGFKRMVNAIDGVRTNVGTRLRSSDGHFDIRPGRQRLRGSEALWYVRDRYSLSNGDFGRTRHQGKFLRFAHRELRRGSADLPAMLGLIGTFRRNTSSNIPLRKLPSLGMLALQIKPKHVEQVSLRGSVGVGSGGASIVYLKPGNTFDRIRAGKVGR